MPEDALIVRLQLASVSLLFVLKQATCLNIFPWCDSFKMPNLSFFTKLTSCLKKIRMQVSTWKPIEKNTLVTGEMMLGDVHWGWFGNHMFFRSHPTFLFRDLATWSRQTPSTSCTTTSLAAGKKKKTKPPVPNVLKEQNPVVCLASLCFAGFMLKEQPRLILASKHIGEGEAVWSAWCHCVRTWTLLAFSTPTLSQGHLLNLILIHGCKRLRTQVYLVILFDVFES